MDSHNASRKNGAFFQGYGPVDLYWPALAYYRYEWAVQEIGEFADLIVRKPDASPVTRAVALAEFITLFGPGREIDSARAADAKLPRGLLPAQG